MASISQIAAGQGEGGRAVRYERVSPADRRLALGVLLTGHAGEHEGSVEHFLRYARDEDMALEELWLAWEAGRPAAATLIVPCPGRTAMQFLSPPSGWSSTATAAGLFHHAASVQNRQNIHLIQSLLDPDSPRLREALSEGGYEELAVLAYMRGRANARPHDLELHGASGHAGAVPDDPPIQVLHWHERRHREAFARAILASYEQTRDCPGLLGRRQIDDIIAGHMAAGQFRPSLWHAFYAGDEPVGVMLLNDVPASDALELVYLGLALPWRGCGLARRLVRHALGEAARFGRSRMILAVDESNAPALKLYRDLGFRTTGRKRAMIFTLSQ